MLRPPRVRPPATRCTAKRTARALAIHAAVVAALALAAAAQAVPPPENQCPTVSGLGGNRPDQDAMAVRLRPGVVLREADLLSLRNLIPPELWRYRDVFFHEGMRMEIGPCHRRYPVPDAYANATAEMAGRAKVDGEGNLRGYVAGLPFPPETIDPGDDDAAVRWAWNLEKRWRGSGPIGSFRLADFPGRIGGVQVYRGTFFFIQTGNRADLAASGYRVPEGGESLWMAGGRFDEPQNARHLAWRQLRRAESLTHYGEPDDTFVYVPTMRKVRRAGTAWVDGLYTPRYRVAGDSGGGGMPIGGGGDFAAGGAVNPTAALSIAQTESLRRGFTGLALRPNAYTWRLQEEREVLAPLNGTGWGYPNSNERNFGPYGLSVATDRWDVRWAVVLQGLTRERGLDFDSLTLYIDYQTQQPLYLVTRRDRAKIVDVTILLHRFSGEQMHYPTWPDGSKALVFDPVAAVSYSAAEGGGWRRESYDVVSTPPDLHTLRSFTSSTYLQRGH